VLEIQQDRAFTHPREVYNFSVKAFNQAKQALADPNTRNQIVAYVPKVVEQVVINILNLPQTVVSGLSQINQCIQNGNYYLAGNLAAGLATDVANTVYLAKAGLSLSIKTATSFGGVMGSISKFKLSNKLSNKLPDLTKFGNILCFSGTGSGLATNQALMQGGFVRIFGSSEKYGLIEGIAKKPSKFENALVKANNYLPEINGQLTSNGKPLLDLRNFSNEVKCSFGESFGGRKISRLFPGAQLIGAEPIYGQTGIDAIYKFSRNGIDRFAIVEYKFGTSELGITRDGLQMSDDWLFGSGTKRNRIFEYVNKNSALTYDIDCALKSDRAIKLLVHTNSFGAVSVGVLDKDAKLISNSIEIIKNFGGKIE